MELLKSIIVDFCLFGIWEGIIYYYFIRKIYNCNKNKKLIVLIAICNSISTNLILPIFYHFIIILYMGVIIYKNSDYNFIKSLKLSGIMILIISFVEMIYSILLEIFLNFDGYCNNVDIHKLFLFSLILKIIEYILINKGEKAMKVFFGEVRK